MTHSQSDIRTRMFVTFSRLDDLETTIADASPEELPKLYPKLEALTNGIHKEFETLLLDYGKSERENGEKYGRSDELLKLSEWGKAIDVQWNSHFEDRLKDLTNNTGEK